MNYESSYIPESDDSDSQINSAIRADFETFVAARNARRGVFDGGIIQEADDEAFVILGFRGGRLCYDDGEQVVPVSLRQSVIIYKEITDMDGATHDFDAFGEWAALVAAAIPA